MRRALLSHAPRAAPAPAGYHAAAVRFDGSQALLRASLIASDSPLGFASLWVLAEDIGIANDSFWLVDSHFGTGMYLGSITPPFTGGPFLARPDGVVNLAGANFANLIPSYGVWVHLLFAWDTTRVSNNFALYKNDTLLSPPIFPANVIGTVGWGEMTSVGVVASTQDAPSTVCRAADYWTKIGSTILQSDGTINLADRRNFISAAGKPVDPAVAVAAYGAPLLLFSGNATTFPINQGTGGAFVVTDAATGTLTRTLADAVDSPST